MGFTRLLRNLTRDEEIGQYVVPIICLVGAAASNLGIRRTLIVPFDRLQPAERAPRPRLVSRRKWMLGLLALLLLPR